MLVYRGNINSHHNGDGRERGGEGLNNIKKISSVLDICGEGFDCRLEKDVYIC